MFPFRKFYTRGNSFCIDHRINLATLLNVTWGILLQRYSNSNDVVFGTTVSGRTPEIKGIENIVGLFINTIPFRIKADGDEKVVDLLKKIDADFTGNFEFQAASLVDIKACTKLSKQEEIFNSIVIIQNYPLDIDLNKLDGKLKVKQHSIFEATNYDLNLEITITNDIKLNFMYNGNRISSDAIYRIAKHYGNILNIIVEKGNIGLDEIDILPNEEKNQILYEFNSTKAEYLKDKTVHQLFEETVDRTPDKVAVVCEEKQLTYRELNERANQLAHLLREKDVTRDSIVGLWTERSLEMIIGILGILKAGGAYLPIDTNYPQDRIEYILEDSGSKLLLTQSLLSKKAVFRQEIILLDDESLYEGAVKNPEKINQPNDLAYIIYTSGSTGKPKGVMIEHHALINRINWMQKKYPISEQDVVLQKTAYTFDVSVWELLWWSQVGATLCLLVPGGEKDPRQITQTIEKNRVTVMHFVPSMLNIFMEYLQINDVEGLSSIRQVFASGEALMPYQVEKFNAILSNRYGTALANLYGPTEAAIDVSYFDCIGKGQLERVPIGKPIDNINLYILDEGKNVQPIGVAGELYIAGVGLARGYLNNTTLTAEKFIDNPFEPGTKMYHTGDLARWLSDGNIEFLGRIDHQVKIRGFRIELGEIETQLLSYQGVNEVIVTAKEDNSGSKYLCAYLVGERDFTVGELRQHLAKELPDYMIPSYFVQMEKLPLTANGKIDRKALPEPDGSMASGITYEAPTNAIEEKLVTIWQEILKIDKIGIRDNFFELGGHSLKAISMVAKIKKELEVEILLKEIFQGPTIKEISDKIKEKEKAAYIKIEHVEEKEYYKASSAQKRLYTLQQFDLESTAYNMFGVLELEGKLDVERLKEAFKALMKRHASLRTSFEIVEEEMVQKIHQEVVFEIEHWDKSSALAAKEEIEEITKGFVRAFDLSKAPLFRVGLISYAKIATEEKHILMYDMHHIISDGTSIGILVDEFIKLYAGEELKELKVQYIDYCAWQDGIIKSEIMQKQEDYWLKEYEEEIPILNLPTDYQRPVIQSFEGDSIYFELEEDITEGLKKIGRETGTTLYMLLLANFNILLSKYTGQEDIVVGSPIAGRPHADLENIIGMFVNTLAIRSNPEGKKTYKEYLDEIKEKCLKAYENQDYQFEELIEKLKVRRDMSRNALFDVMLVLQNTEIRELAIEDLSFREYKGENKVAKFDITINAVELEKKIGLNIEYCTKLFSKDTIERLRKHLVNIIANTIVNQDIKLSAIDMLTSEEKQKLLYTFNNTHAEYPKDKTIQELFEAQVENTPDKVAVVFEAKQLTYRELNERANQLARVLVAKGVSKDSIIGIIVERSLEMIIGIMGILKAGGAYLPIDPAYPIDRTQYMLADSQTKILLTHKELGSKIGDVIEQINLDEESLYQGESSNLDKAYDAGSLAYVIYTSGSTGKPKGVMIEHRNVINTLTGLEKAYPVNEEDAYLLKTTYTFDVSVTELFGWFMGKGRLEILPQGKEKDPREITKVIEERSITHINFVPSMLNLWIEELGKGIRQQQSKLKYVMAAGEALSSSTTESFYKEEKQARLENIYGPTEITIYATSCAIEKNKLYSNISIGKPMQNVKAYILDKNNKLCPIGVAGELCIAGEGLARGYLNRTELTAEKFIDNPFELGTKMYRTGDLARWLSDGNIEFLGRIDHQVKIRGYRIELGEIETQLLSYQGVKEVIVTAKEDNSGSKYLCAYLVGERDFTVGELRQHLGKELPDYMIPSYFVQMEKLPLTANGKIDRKALPEPDGSMASGITYEAPANAIEEKLVTIWQEILKIDKIGIRDNFFELGGHSLKATSMVAKIQKELEVEILLKEIFQGPTIKEISDKIKEKEKAAYIKIEPVEEKEYYKASSAQKRLYTLQQFDLESTSYNMPMVLKLKGELDKQKLEDIFKQLIQRHESLRTSFEIRNEEIVQIVHKEVAFSISDYGYIETESEAEIQENIKDFVKAFDLSKAHLLRVGLMSYAKEKQARQAEHILMIDMHHIITDGVSMGILTKDFIELYEGEALTDLTIQYKDYSTWQNEMIETGKMQKQEAYWGERFSDELPILNMSTDYPRPVQQSFEGDNIDFELDKETTKKLNRLANQTGTTMYMLLLSAYNILLSKYSSQEDIIIGSPIAGRTHGDLENIIGMFVNTLAMRNFPESNKTFSEFLREVKENTLTAYENQEYQFEELVDKINVRRDLSRNPIFDVMFVMQNMNIESRSIEGLEISYYDAENKISKFDISLNAEEAEDKLRLKLEYCTKLFEKETIERLAKHYINILKAITKNQEIKLGEIDYISMQEKEQLLEVFNNTKADYPRDKTIHELFEAQVQKIPDNIAVVYEAKQLTYSELNERANQLARVLLTKGVSTDSIVGIMVERSLEMIIGIMGILKAGGAYLPIDPAYPTDRTQYMLADSQTKILLTHKGLGSKIGDVIEQINLDEESLYQGESSNLNKAYDAGSLAYVIYTSGSTGKPKGVMIEHRNVINTLTGLEKAYPVNEEDAYLLKTTYTFDVSVTELFGWFMGKGRLEILPQGKEKDPREITKVIEERSITHINFVPSMLNLWIEELGKGIRQQQSKLKYVMAAGEALSSSTTESFYKEEKQARLENIYGPTEITIYATSCAIEKNKLYNNISIGKPMQNVKAYILDSSKKLCPIGVAGELCIAGDGLARGYLNRAELTVEKFIDNPFELGTKMYRTGDLARWLSDGNIEFLGRIDHQVKIRGYRIELGEIETQLLSYEAVKEVIITAKEDNSGSRYLCAYIVGERDFTVGELRQHLAKELPEYMIPSYFVQLEKLPLTANGKIDRKALPEPDGSMASGITYEAPTNAVEEKLVTIWQEILKIDKIGIRDNFFELGGHSLKATSMVAKIQKELEVEILLKEIFQEPTIKELAAAIKEKEKVTYAKIEPVEEKEYYKASSAQKRLYTLQQFDLESTSYNMPIVLRLKGSLDKQKLENIFKQLIQRHEALRTSFGLRNEEIVQIVHQAVAFHISDYVYIEAESETVIQESIRGFVKVFDLSKVPLIRVALVKINEKEHVLMIDMHHIISDGVSMGILTKEFAELYGGKELSKLRIQYKDFAEWQNKLFKSGEIKKQEEYWLKTFEGEIPVLNLPTDYQRPSIQSFEGDNLSFELNYELTGKLKQIAKETGSTMYMVLLSACNILLSKYSGQEDIVIGSPIAGRLHADLENIMGMFVNTLAMRSFPAGNKTFKEFLGEVKANSLSSFEGQDYQFEELIDKLSITRDLSRNPLFDVMFSMHNVENKEISIGELKISPYNAENNISKFDMTLTAVESEDNIGFNLNYCTRLFGKKTIEKLIKHFTNILEAISNNINQNISEVEMLTKEEKQQLLVEFNNTKADYPKHKTIHELFEEQAQSTPNAVAVVYEDESLTYNSLNERSNQIARILRSKGVKADSIVAIMVERSAEMITGIMGIIKAGGAYLPIDPEYPNDRIAYMLEDSKANILITQTHLINKGDFGVDIIDLTDKSIYSEDNSNLDNINTENNLVYTIYTSGSTGKPKGVMVEHKNLVNLVYGLIERIYKENKNLKVSMVSPYVFDASVKQIFPSLLLGHTLCIIPEDTRFDGYKLFDYYANNSIDIADGTPTHLKMLTSLEKQTDNIGIKQFVIGGEALSTELVEEYYSKYNKNCIINNVYGPTECCDVTTMLSVTSNMEIKSPIVSIGYPISNATVYILDKYSKAVPVGVLGELCISGAGVTRGYLNRAELTAEKFVDNPYDMTQKLYKTGDLVRWTEAGNIEFLGRIDHQVKIRGFRIELGEIEARLLSYEGIEEAIVIAREAEGNKYICAYITGAREFTISELREYLLKELPEYMMPSYFIQLEQAAIDSKWKDRQEDLARA